MKIALILTGQLRSWRLCSHVVKNCLLKHHDCDVFMSVDLDNKLQHEGRNPFDITNQKELEDVIEFYNPKKFFLGSGYNENLYEKVSNDNLTCISSPIPEVKLIDGEYLISSYSMLPDICTHTVDNRSRKVYFEQYYYCKKAYELLEKFISETQTEYECIIRLRFDQFIWSDEMHANLEKNKEGILYTETNISLAKNYEKILRIDQPKKNEIFVFGCGIYHNYVYINDQFWVHGMDLITHMKNFYDSLPIIINSCRKSYPSFGASIEHFFALYLKGIKVKRSCISGIFVRVNNTG